MVAASRGSCSVVVVVQGMGLCSGKETHAETSQVRLFGILSLMTAVGAQFDRRQSSLMKAVGSGLGHE